MCLMTSSVMSARELAVVGSLHLSSVPMSPVSSITASTAGHRSTPDLDVSSTNHWSRRVLIDPALCPSAGARLSKGNSVK